MPKETKEERDARRAREESAAQVALEAYFASVPKRLMEAQALANSMYVSTSVTWTPAGPIVHFEYDNEKYKIFIDSALTYQTEEWELESLEGQLKQLKETIDQEQERFRAAQGVWAALSDADRRVLKEFIYQMRP